MVSLLPRRGDMAQLVRIEWTDLVQIQEKKEKKTEKKKEVKKEVKKVKSEKPKEKK
jgi:hypothetical protein